MLINREEFLQILESVSSGLSTTGTEQGKSFVFKDKKVMTFNGECLVQRKVPIDLTGAVEADPLLKIIGKMTDEEIDIQSEETQLLIKVCSKTKEGKNVVKKKAGVLMDSVVSLPVDLVDSPKEWKELPEEFGEAITTVGQCSSKVKDTSEWLLSCIHIHPKWIESGDYYQVCRYRLRMGIENSILVKQQAIKGMSLLGMTEFSETESWLHFRNPSGVRYSCRRHMADYPSISEHFKFEGETIVLPKDLSEAVGRAEISAKEDSDLVIIDLSTDKVRVKGIGTKSWYVENKKVKYAGPPISFYISPKMLINLSKKFSEGIVCQNKLKFDNGNYKLLCYLRKNDKKEE